jgi:predicted Zn-dependent protease
MGFSALALQEGRSFLCDRLGQQIVSEQISIWDDGLDPRGTPLPFDFEGVPKRRVDLIERGVARGVVYDSETAAREGKRSTGHALPAPNVWGPFPINLFLGTGDRSRSELLGALDRGVLVTRFWYVNPVHPRQAVLTGMTRDGTFLVERGEIVRPVRNLRFTQSMLDALGATLGVGSVATPTEAFFGATVVPPLLLGRFTFTGVSEL